MNNSIAFKLKDKCVDLVALEDENSDVIDACNEMIDQANALQKENQELRQEVNNLKRALESKKRYGISEFTPIRDDTKRLKVEPEAPRKSSAVFGMIKNQ
jgi:hypothetical protein